MIADKFVDLYARNSGLRDKLIAERDVVLTYALRALDDAGVMKHLAFTRASRCCAAFRSWSWRSSQTRAAAETKRSHSVCVRRSWRSGGGGDRAERSARVPGVTHGSFSGSTGAVRRIAK